MRRIALRIALGGLLLFILCAGLAGFALSRFDPDEYRDDLAHHLSLQIGRPVHINGPVQAFYYPWLGLEARSISVPDVDEVTPLLAVASIKLRVRLLPLLRKELVMDRVVAVEPEVWFRRDATGKSNWEELVRQTEARLQAMPEPTSADAEWLAVRQIVFSGFTVRGGVLHYRDEYLDLSFDAERIELKTGGGDSFPYELEMRVESASSRFRAFLEAQGMAHVDLFQPSLVLEKTNLQVRLRTEFLGREVGAALGGRLRLDSGAEAFDLDDAYLRSPGLRLEGRASGKGLLSREPVLAGEMSVSVPEPEVWLQPEGPLPRKFEALPTSFSGQTDFVLSHGDILFSGLEFHALDTPFAGQARISPGDSPQISLSVRTESLDADRFLPSFPVFSGQETGVRSTLPPAALVAKLLKSLGQVSLKADVKAREAVFGKERFSGVLVRLTADQEEVTLGVEMEEYRDGRLQVQGRAQPGQDGWRLGWEADLKGVQAGPLVKQALGWEVPSGSMDALLSAKAGGETISDLAATFSARGEVKLVNATMALPSGEGREAEAEQSRVGIPDSRMKFSLAGPGRDRFDAAKPLTPYALELDFKTMTGGRKRITSALKGKILLDRRGPRPVRLEGAHIRAGYRGPAGPFEEVRGVVSGVLDMDLEQGAAKLRLARVESQGGILHGHVEAMGLFGPLGNATVAGTVDKSSIFPRELLRGLGIPLPWAMNATALREGEILASFNGDSRGLELKDLSLELDGDRLAGEAFLKWGRWGRWWQSGHQPFARFDLESESINLDRYLPFGNQTKSEEADGVAGDWDMAFLNELDFEGLVRMGTLRVGGLKYSGVTTQLEGAEGVVNATSVAQDFYSGKVDARLALDAREAPAFSANAVFEGFDLRPALQDMFGEKNFAGRTTVRFVLESEGRNREAHVRSLSGAAAVRIRDGYYRVFTPSGVKKRNYRETRDITGKTPDRPTEAPRTLFNKAEADFHIKQGVILNDNFTLRGPLVKTNGEGIANLPENEVEYQLVMQTTALPSVVMRIHGALDDPTVDVEGGSVMTDTMKRMGGSVFDLFKNIFILPFNVLEGLDEIGNDTEEAGEQEE
jgi:AsmA protein